MIIFDGLNFGEGWRPDIAAEEVPRAIEDYGLRPLASFVPSRAPREFVDLTVYLKRVWGDSWELNQLSCGSCVAFGLAGCADVLTAIATVASESPVRPRRSDPMTLYWGSRVEIGGGRIRARAVSEFGRRNIFASTGRWRPRNTRATTFGNTIPLSVVDRYHDGACRTRWNPWPASIRSRHTHR